MKKNQRYFCHALSTLSPVVVPRDTLEVQAFACSAMPQSVIFTTACQNVQLSMKSELIGARSAIITGTESSLVDLRPQLSLDLQRNHPRSCSVRRGLRSRPWFLVISCTEEHARRAFDPLGVVEVRMCNVEMLLAMRDFCPPETEHPRKKTGDADNDNDTLREVPHLSDEGLALQARV